MKISYQWLKKYIDFNLTPEDLGEILTNTGLEVESVSLFEKVQGGLSGVVIGEIVQCEPHPDADKLKVTKVDIGNGELLQIVCGAPNCRIGLKSPVALVGTTLFPSSGEKLTIKKAKIRGVESFGMICADDELGLGRSHAGIMELDSAASNGLPAAKYFQLKQDHLLEIGLTPNRGDAFSHLGVARDLSAALKAVYKIDLPVQRPALSSLTSSATLPFPITVNHETGCRRYAALLLKEVKVGPSPEWLRDQLAVIGLRSINNVVDITNYVLHECGQPLHAFDAQKINGRLEVRLAAAGESFQTLDGQQLKLHQDDVLIADAKGGLCLAGVYGGANSGVSDSTTEILLESACFDAVRIRKTSGRHQLHTDAAQHFEKGSDINAVPYALQRAASLLMEYAGATLASGTFDYYPQPIAGFPVQFSLKRLAQYAGVALPESIVRDILKKLDINIEQEANGVWDLMIPTCKTEVLREADVIEEVLRIYGYNNIPVPAKLNASITYGVRSLQDLENKAAEWLIGAGFREISTNSVAQAKWEQDAQLQQQQVKLLNSQTAELDVLRTSMVYSALEVIAYNQNRKQADLRLFEFGKTYHKINDEYIQRSHLVLLLTGKCEEDDWLQKSEGYNFYHLKAYASQLLRRFGYPVPAGTAIEEQPFQFGLSWMNADSGAAMARLGSVSPAILKQFDVRQPVYIAVIDWEMLTNRAMSANIRFNQLPKYPAVRRDLAVVVDATLPFANIEALIHSENKKLLRDVMLFDVYQGEKIGVGKKSLAVSCTFRDEEKTLTDADIDKAVSRIIKRLETEAGAEIRKA
ncbi:MAG: phenylalanine--tRNA ligase subunit beta [Chitinophagales bacterium]